MTAGLAALLNTEGEDWMLDALCAQVDPDLWFPDKGGSSRPAKAVCTRCPVTARCLEYALEHQERFGIWGGASERERRRMDNRRRPHVEHHPRPPRAPRQPQQCPDCDYAGNGLAAHRRWHHATEQAS